MPHIRIITLSLSLLLALPSLAQTDKVTVSGSVQSDMLVPLGDQDDGSNEDFRTNTYVDASLQSRYVDAGVRFEYLEHPLPGFEKDFKGWGVPYFYVKGKYKWAELTAGNIYEQFGSGFVLRTYEERSLGIDNSILGGRLVLRPVKGVQLKALSGKQRRYWAHNDSWVSGADLELSLDQWLPTLATHGNTLTIGGSWVNKHEKASDDQIFASPTYMLRLPENVNAFDGRINFITPAWNILMEYAHKTQDPSFDNSWIYRPGNVVMLSASYSHRGLSLLAQAKRSDNFAFRSRRSMNGTSSFINHLPAFTMDHTYTLAALYPYATHPEGEWAYQAQLGYRFPRHSALGGRYGMLVKVNFSHVHAIDQSSHPLTVVHGTVTVPFSPTITTGNDYNVSQYSRGGKGYGSAFWKWGDQTYYQDLNVQMERRLSRDFKLSLMYMNQFYNKTIVEGEGGMIHSDIFVADGLINLRKQTRLRLEAQWLATDDDQKDWIFGLAELSLVPHWMLTVSDNYNCGSTHEHYYQGLVTYTTGAHRLQAGFGRTRAGYNCSGGVCRYVPETKGFTVSYNYNF